jgi:hypothetical protein
MATAKKPSESKDEPVVIQGENAVTSTTNNDTPFKAPSSETLLVNGHQTLSQSAGPHEERGAELTKEATSEEPPSTTAEAPPPQDGESSTSQDEDTPRKKRKSVLARMRESQPYEEKVDAQSRVTITYRKPTTLDWFRVHPDKDYCTPAFLVTIRRDRHPYVVFGEELQELLRRRKQGGDVTIYTCVDRHGEVFLWDIPTTANEWSHSKRRAALRGQLVWVRIASNQAAQRYNIEESTHIPEPQWPPIPFETMIDEIFADYIIDSREHEIMRELLGEA